MQKLKKGIIKTLNTILSTIDTTKLDSEVRVKLVRNFITTRIIANDLNLLEEDTVKKIVTEEYRTLQAKENKNEEETKLFNTLTEQVNKEYIDILNPVLNEEIEVDLKEISEDEFDKLVSGISNLNLSQFDLLHELLIKKD